MLDDHCAMRFNHPKMENAQPSDFLTSDGEPSGRSASGDNHNPPIPITGPASTLTVKPEGRKGQFKSAIRKISNRSYAGDPALVQACLNGDQGAWDSLVERYGRLVYSIPRRSGLSAGDAEDVFQNAFTILFNRLASLRNQTCLAAWLITTTYRECWRLGKLTPTQADLTDSIADTGTPLPEQVERWEQQFLVREALNQLGPNCQELLKALFFDTSSPGYEEIGARLGLAVGSIGPTRARCLKKLESILADMGVDYVSWSS